MIKTQQLKRAQEISPEAIWEALNTIKNCRLVYSPASGRYIVGAHRSYMDRDIAIALHMRGLIEAVPNRPAVYEMTAEGSEVWSNPPEGMQITGRCDNCDMVKELTDFHGGEFTSCCPTCVGGG